jgi:hypothetical protein
VKVCTEHPYTATATFLIRALCFAIDSSKHGLEQNRSSARSIQSLHAGKCVLITDNSCISLREHVQGLTLAISELAAAGRPRHARPTQSALPATAPRLSLQSPASKRTLSRRHKNDVRKCKQDSRKQKQKHKGSQERFVLAAVTLAKGNPSVLCTTRGSPGQKRLTPADSSRPFCKTALVATAVQVSTAHSAQRTRDKRNAIVWASSSCVRFHCSTPSSPPT